MAGISITHNISTNVQNIPYNAGSSFGNSPMYDYTGDVFFTQTPDGNVVGLDLDFGGAYRIGDKDYSIGVGSGISGIAFKGIGITSNTAGGDAGRHLIINVNGNDRKIKLLNL